MFGNLGAHIFSIISPHLISLWQWFFHLILRCVLFLAHFFSGLKRDLKELKLKFVYDKPRQCVEKQRHYSANKGPYSHSYGLPSDHVRLWELDHQEGGALKNWCLWTMVLEKTPESPLDGKEIKPVNLKGNQPWILVGKTDAEVEIPVFWLSDSNIWLIGKVPDMGKDWGQKEKRV